MAKKDNLLLDVLRVIPEDDKIVINKKNDRLTDLLAILIIFAIAYYIRFLVRGIVLNEYDDHVYDYLIPGVDYFNFGSYLGLESGDTVYFGGYDDFHYYYIDYVNAFSDGWNPYTGSQVDGDHLAGYVYGPIYIYSISAGSYFFDLSAYDSILFSNIIFDSACYPLVYLIGKKVTGNIVALIAGIVGSFSPIAIFYTSVRLLNAPAMNFFALLFVYYFLEKKDGRAAFALALGTMTKQFPLFLALPFGFWMMRRYGIFKGIGMILVFVFDTILLSYPYSAKTPGLFFRRLFLAGGGKGEIGCPRGGEATNLIQAGISKLCSQNGGILPSEEVPRYITILNPLVNYHIVFFFFVILLGLIAFTGYEYFEKNPRYYLIFFAAFYTIVHATIARGIFKYYATILIPFLILAFVPGNRDKSLHFQFGGFLHTMIRKWVSPERRWSQENVQYWFGLLYVLVTFVGIGWMIDALVSLFTTTSGYHTFWVLLFFSFAIFAILRPGPEFNYKNHLVLIPKIKDSFIVIQILSVVGIFYASKIMKLYFQENNFSLIYNYYIIVIFIAYCLSLPILEWLIFKEKKTFNVLSFEWSQIFWDLILITIGFIILTFFHREFLLISKDMTTVVLLFMGFLLMGMLGGEIWGSLINVPRAFLKRYRKMSLNYQ